MQSDLVTQSGSHIICHSQWPQQFNTQSNDIPHWTYGPSTLYLIPTRWWDGTAEILQKCHTWIITWFTKEIYMWFLDTVMSHVFLFLFSHLIFSMIYIFFHVIFHVTPPTHTHTIHLFSHFKFSHGSFFHMWFFFYLTKFIFNVIFQDWFIFTWFFSPKIDFFHVYFFHSILYFHMILLVGGTVV